MFPAFYERLEAGSSDVGDGVEVSRFSALPTTGGPWSPDYQHGGPPSALMVRAAESLAARLGRAEMFAARLAAEFLGPVPVGELEVRASAVRSGRTTLLVSVELAVAGSVRMLGRVWLLRLAPPDDRLALPITALPITGMRSPELLTPPDAEVAGWSGIAFPYGEQIEWRFTEDHARTEGRATAWVRPRIALVGGELATGLQRTALCGDSASGVSAPLSWEAWTFPNVDLDIHISRPVVGSWLRMDAQTLLATTGTAVARCSYADVEGTFGGSLQTLVVQPVLPTRAMRP